MNIEEYIALYPTDSSLHGARRALPGEPDTSVRADLVAQVAGAQAQIESEIEILRRAAVAGGDTAALAMAEGQLQGLSNLQRRIEHAGPGALAAIRAEVVAFIAASQATGQLTRAATATAQNAEVALHAAQAEARKAVADFTHDFYERKIFDPYLQFASAEDERAYREREEKNRREIEKARAEGTPEGELRAARLAKEQLRDAGAHGATRSDEYAPQWEKLDKAERNLAAEMGHASPQVPIAEKSTAAVDPLDDIAPASNVPPGVIASLRAAGVTIPPQEAKGHGVAENGANTAPRGRV